MNENKSHDTVYEKHKIVSMIISVIVMIFVTFSFTLISIYPTKKTVIATKKVETTNHYECSMELINFTNFHTFADIYAEVVIPDINLESIKVESSVTLPSGETLSEKRIVYDVKCPEGKCEKILLASISPIRDEKYSVSTVINTEHVISSIKYSAEYQSYAYVVVMC